MRPIRITVTNFEKVLLDLETTGKTIISRVKFITEGADRGTPCRIIAGDIVELCDNASGRFERVMAKTVSYGDCEADLEVGTYIRMSD